MNTPDAFKYAAWTVYSEESHSVIIEDFLQRWKGLTPDILAHVLQEEKEDRHDKLFVLSALGYLAPSGARSLLLPFVHSRKRSERWLSTFSLGQLKEPMVFPLLQHMLLEDLLNPNAFDEDAYDDSDWYMIRRFEIALHLGDWGNTDAIAPLCEAIRQCWAMAANPDVYFGDSSPTIEGYDTTASVWWDPFLYRLAYALGRLGAREALEPLSLPPAHFHIVKLYFLYGTLQEIKGHILHYEGWEYLFYHLLVAQLPNGTIETRYYPPAKVMQALQTHFGLSVEEQEAFLHQAIAAYQQKKFERYPRNTPGYEDRFPPPVHYPAAVWLVDNEWKEGSIHEAFM